jgi:transcriptional regulator with XRE-family HTH domain
VTGTSSLSWRRAATKLLAVTDVTQAALARELELSRPNVSRWLAGTVRPSPSSRQALDRALANLVGEPDVAAYLAAVAVREGLQTDERDYSRIFTLTRWLLAGHARFGPPNDPVFQEFVARDPAKAVRVCATLALARGREIVSLLEGSASRRPLFEALDAFCGQLGLGYDSQASADFGLALLRLLQRSRFDADNILARASGTPRERIALASKLKAMLGSLFAAIWEASSLPRGGSYQQALISTALQLPAAPGLLRPSRSKKRQREARR